MSIFFLIFRFKSEQRSTINFRAPSKNPFLHLLRAPALVPLQSPNK